MLIENEIVDYEKNKLDIDHWVLLKGEYRYKRIITFLKIKNIECTWKNISNYVRYDKRILINSLKYIVFLEEMYKSFVVKYKGEKNTKVLSQSFDNSYNEFLSLGDMAKYDGVDLELMKKEHKAINSFRNSVVHNKILIDRTFASKKLEEVMDVFMQILPKTYRRGFIKNINECIVKLDLDNYWHIVLPLGDK